MHKSYRYLEDKLSRRYFSIMVSVTAIVGLTQILIEALYRQSMLPVIIGVVGSVPVVLFPFYMRARTIEASSNFIFGLAISVQSLICIRLFFHDGIHTATLLWMILPALYTLVYTDNKKTYITCAHMGLMSILVILAKAHGLQDYLGVKIEALGENTFTHYNFFFPLSAILIFILSYSFDRKRLAEKMEEKEKRLESWAKFASLGEMSSGMAHEINNPVAVVKGYLSILRRKLSRTDLDSKDYDSILNSCDEAVIRITNIIRSLKSVSRQDPSETAHECELSSLWQEVEILCQHGLRDANVELELQSNISSEDVLILRFTHILQVLVNLINNARDAITEREKRWIKVQFNKLGESYLEIAVQDSGHGIFPEVASMLFTPFFTTKELGKGTGLGLTLSQKLIHAHGGELYYELRDGHTTFVMRLPGALKHQASKAQQAA